MTYEIVKRLDRYSEQCVSERLDPDYAVAVKQTKTLLIALQGDVDYLRKQNTELYCKLKECKEELCYHCGGYRNAHMGYCDDCKWKEGG